MEDPRLTSHCRCVGRKTSAKATDEILQKAVKVCSVCKKPWKKTREKKTLHQTSTKKNIELYYTQLKIGTSKKLDFFERFHSRNLPFFPRVGFATNIIHRCPAHLALKVVSPENGPVAEKSRGVNQNMTTWNHKPKFE